MVMGFDQDKTAHHFFLYATVALILTIGAGRFANLGHSKPPYNPIPPSMVKTHPDDEPDRVPLVVTPESGGDRTDAIPTVA